MEDPRILSGDLSRPISSVDDPGDTVTVLTSTLSFFPFISFGTEDFLRLSGPSMRRSVRVNTTTCGTKTTVRMGLGYPIVLSLRTLLHGCRDYPFMFTGRVGQERGGICHLLQFVPNLFMFKGFLRRTRHVLR